MIGVLFDILSVEYLCSRCLELIRELEEPNLIGSKCETRPKYTAMAVAEREATQKWRE